MRLLLDTVTLSELRRGDKAHPTVVKWQATLGAEPLALSVITLNEICYGIQLVASKDPPFATLLTAWYKHLTDQPQRFPILPIDRPIAEAAASLRYQHKMPYNDALIAATAQVHRLTLATRNLKDFQQTGIPLLNPWDFKETS